MRFVEETGANWAAVQIRAVEMEIEQQKREWEEKRSIQRQQEELEKQRAEKEENEILTYSREDALNKVNIRSKKNPQVLGKRKSENANSSPKTNTQARKSNGTEVMRNGVVKSEKVLKTPPKKIDTTPRRNTRNTTNRSMLDENSSSVKANSQRLPPRGTSRKSDRSTSIHSNSVKSHTRSTSESTSRSTADSMSLQTATTTHSPDESDSECSLDVMIDSNDVNDSDSNSNQIAGNTKNRNRFDSTSHDDDTLLNDDSTMTDETTIEKMSKKSVETSDGKNTSSPRTRSRGTVNVNLWTLDESPILPPKRQKTFSKLSLDSQQKKDEKELKADFGVKECKVSVIDINTNPLKPPMIKPSPKSRAHKQPLAKQINTLDSWIQKAPAAVKQSQSDARSESDKESVEERIPITRQRRNIILQKTL